jgi:fructose-1,6-bisphosphatase/inositol monophosphatase family enzyme
VKEAGGIVCDINGEELAYDRQCSVVARNRVVPMLAVNDQQ